MRSSPRVRPSFEWLERRDCPAPLNVFFDSAGNLQVVGTATGTLALSINAAGDVNVIDDALGTPVDLGTYNSANVTVRLGNQNDNVLVDLSGGGSLSGRLSIDTANGSDTITVAGAGGMIGGDLYLSNANQSSVSDITVNGRVAWTAEGSSLANTLTLSSATLDGNVTARSAAALSAGVSLTSTTIGGGLNAVLGSSNLNTLQIDDTSSVAGNLTYTGGSGGETVTIAGQIAGNALINMGNAVGITVNDFDFLATGSILGSLNVIGNSGADSVDTFLGTVLGNLSVRLGNGNNSLTLGGTILGSSIVYIGGNNQDTLTFAAAAAAPGASLTAYLGNAADTFALNSAALARALVDGGFGTNTFTPGVTVNFPFLLRRF